MNGFLMLFLFFGGTGGSSGDARYENIDPGLVDLIEKIDEKAATITSLKARFVQRKEISLLKEPVEKKGTFYLKRPDGFKLDFDPEEDLVMIITNEEMVAISPSAKKAEQIKLKKRQIGLTQRILSDKLGTMVNYFNITRAVRTGGPGGQRLVLTPNKRKLKKKFREIEIWIDDQYLIHKLKVTSKDGDVHELSLIDIQLNVPIDAKMFDTSIPEDFEVGDRLEYLFGPGMSF